MVEKHVYTFEDILKEKGYLVYTNVGYSMMPLLRQRRDIIEIRPKKPGQRFNKYDAVLYKRGRSYILHRIIKVREKDYVICGDHNIQKEYGIIDDQILGIMTRVIRDGKSIDCQKNKLYRLYVHLWVDFFPIKVFLLKTRAFLTRVKRITPSKLKKYLNWEIVYAIDRLMDYKITGKDLTRTEKSPFCDVYKGLGMTSSQPAKYLILKKVFSHVNLTASDTIIDVGCGKGRCIAFLISQNCPCEIYGVELSEVPGKIAVEWTKKYSNVHVILEDAFSLDYNRFTVLYVNQPFLPNTFYEFVQLLEKQLNHAVTFIYLFDYASGGYLEGREGWKLQYRENIFKIYGLQVVGGPLRRFSIWTYTPRLEANK